MYRDTKNIADVALLAQRQPSQAEIDLKDEITNPIPSCQLLWRGDVNRADIPSMNRDFFRDRDIPLASTRFFRNREYPVTYELREMAGLGGRPIKAIS